MPELNPPPVPATFVAREEIAALRKAVLGEAGGGAPPTLVTGLHGQGAGLAPPWKGGPAASGRRCVPTGGLGKTTLAAALCRDPAIRARFSAVLWVQCREGMADADVLHAQRLLARAFGARPRRALAVDRGREGGR